MNNKPLIILAATSLSFTAFLGGYLISQKDFHRNPNSLSTGSILDKFNGGDSKTNSQIESSKNLRLLSPRGVISPVLSKEKDGIIFYEKNTGKVFEVALKDLKEKSVSDISLDNLTQTTWSPSRKDVVSVFYYPKGNRYKYFNYKTKFSVDLGTDIKSLVFSPDGSQMAYFGTKDGSGGIFISQPDGSASKKILPSRLDDIEIYWPSNDLIYFKTTTANGSGLFSLTKIGEVREVLGSKNNLDVKWSKDGSRVLFSETKESTIRLFYKDLSSNNEVLLGISTKASKCDLDINGETVVCGVPRPSASGDEIYEINNATGLVKLLSSPTSKIDTAELFLSGLGDYVTILNSLDDKLYLFKK